MPKVLNHRISRGMDGKPVIVLDFDDKGYGFEFRLDGVRKMADALNRIAEEAATKDMGRGYRKSAGEDKL